VNRILDLYRVRELRALYEGNPVIDRAEQALRDLGVRDPEDAAVMLPMWAHVGDLSDRERQGVLARFAGPLDAAEVERVREARAKAYERQDELMQRGREGEISMDELLELSEKIEWPRWSRWKLGPCMPSCALEHGPDDALDDVVSHEKFVALIPSSQPGGSVRVWWGFVDDLADGTRSRPEVQCSGADDGLSPQGARLLAEALVQAAAAVEAWRAGA
jgi:hypothetical protein